MKPSLLLPLLLLPSLAFAEALPILTPEQIKALDNVDNKIQETDSYRSQYHACPGSDPSLDLSHLKEESSYRSREAIQSRLSATSPTLQSLAKATLKGHPEMSGTIKFVLTVQPDGQVSRLDSFVTSPSLCKLAEALGGAIRQMSFGPASGGPDVFVRSYNFSSH